ncbi:MAG: cation:proton antiporter [Meiothermus sp.]|nr:cation:proton antiporter [Meiothermus sp.]
MLRIQTLLGLWLTSLALAEGTTPPFFGEVALLLVASAVIAFVSTRAGLVPIIGFLLVGLAIGPGGLGLVRDPELINAAAEIGVVLLLFTIGIEFSLERLGRIARLVFVGGGLQVGLTATLVMGAMALLGASWQEGLFTGFLIAISSTTIAMKLLSDKGQTTSSVGQASLGISIFQDLGAVAMVLVVPLLATRGATVGTGLGDLLLTFVEAALLIGGVLFLARRGMPQFLEGVARSCSREVFLLVVIAVCFGVAFLTSLTGLSLALGAFLAGLLVSESRFGQQALGEIFPLQILFSAAFFISVGLLFDLRFVLGHLLLVLGLFALVLTLKVGVIWLAARVLGFTNPTGLRIGLALSNIGEFAFVLERVGREAGLSAFGFEGGSQTFIAVTVLSMITTPFLVNWGERLREKVGGTAATPESPGEIATEGFDHLRNHVILAGYGDHARKLAFALQQAEIPFLILTLSPDGANEAEQAGYPVLRGDYANVHILALAGVERARLLVIADDEAATVYRVASVVRGNHPDLPILARTRLEHERAELLRAGVSQVVVEEEHSARALMQQTLSYFDRTDGIEAFLNIALRQGAIEQPSQRAEVPQVAARMFALSTEEIARGHCAHTEWANPIRVTSSVCADCVALGDSWVHLRVCMTCGYVGCCDDSKNKHATAHFKSTGHPLIKSLEKGETWTWCYVDQKIL